MFVTLGFNYKGILQSLTVHLKFLITTSFGGSTEGGAGLCSLITDGRTQGGNQAAPGKAQAGHEEKFFTVSIVKHCKRLPSKVSDALCLPVFKKHLDNTLSNLTFG